MIRPCWSRGALRNRRPNRSAKRIPEAERDPDLGTKLWAERSGILNWLIKGLLDYLENGLAPPEQVAAATRDYREDSDPIGCFLTDACVVTGQASDTLTSKELCEGFNYYLYERGENQWKPGTVSRQIKTKSKTWQNPANGRQFGAHKASIIRYSGVRFADLFGRRFRNAPRDQQGWIIGPGLEGEVETPVPEGFA